MASLLSGREKRDCFQKQDHFHGENLPSWVRHIEHCHASPCSPKRKEIAKVDTGNSARARQLFSAQMEYKSWCDLLLIIVNKSPFIFCLF